MKNAILLTDDNDTQIGVINSKGLSEEEVEVKVITALEEHYDEEVTSLRFDWVDFNGNYKPSTMYVSTGEAAHIITVEETWIY